MVCQIAQWGENQNIHSSFSLTFSLRNDLALTEQFPCTPGFPFTDWWEGGHVIELKENQIWMFCSDPCSSGPSTSLITGPWCALCHEHSLPHSCSQRSLQSTNLTMLLFLKSQRFPSSLCGPISYCILFEHAYPSDRSPPVASGPLYALFCCLFSLNFYSSPSPNLHITPLEQLTSHTTAARWLHAL